MSVNTPLIAVEDLCKVFDVSAPWLERLIERKPRALLRAVDGVSFTIGRGETFALVGESGCGKSTVARMLVGLERPSRGHVTFDGHPIESLSTPAGRPLRRRLQMIFQDPYSSLNPRWRVAQIVGEPLRVHRIVRTRDALDLRVATLLEQVGLAPADGAKFPHQFSGGQRQRISIARALASEPSFLVADEPTSALDVSIQAQVLNLMKDLQRRLGLTYLVISHNLAVVHFIADRVGVMYLGRVMEAASRATLFGMPQHPYTRMLIDALPDLDRVGRARTPVGGEVPNPLAPPHGCAFHPRCRYADAQCRREVPALRQARGGALVACHAVHAGRLEAIVRASPDAPSAPDKVD